MILGQLMLKISQSQIVIMLSIISDLAGPIKIGSPRKNQIFLDSLDTTPNSLTSIQKEESLA